MKKLLLLSLMGLSVLGLSQSKNSKNKTVNQQKQQKKVTIGRDRLGEFAPKFAEINDDIVYGEIWSREKELSSKIRSMITISSIISSGNYPEQLKYQMQQAKDEYGVSKEEMSELITHLAFYVGGHRAWSAFQLAMEVYGK